MHVCGMCVLFVYLDLSIFFEMLQSTTMVNTKTWKHKSVLNATHYALVACYEYCFNTPVVSSQSVNLIVCLLPRFFQMDVKDSAAGDYREGEMLAAGGINDKDTCIGGGKKDEEDVVTGEQFGMELCDHPHEHNIVASENKDVEDHSLAYRDELPSTGVENAPDEDHFLVHGIELPSVVIETEDDEDHSPVHRDELPSVTIGSNDDEDHSLVYRDELPSVTIGSKDDEDHSPVHRYELPSVTIGSKDDEDHSPVHRDELPSVTIGSKDDGDNYLVHRDELPYLVHIDELPTVVLENKDQLDGLEATDVDNFTIHSCQATSHNAEEQLTDVISSTHRQSPSPPNVDSSEEEPFVTSRNEDKYIVAAHLSGEVPTSTDQQGDLHTIANGNTDTVHRGDGWHFGEQVIVAYIS